MRDEKDAGGSGGTGATSERPRISRPFVVTNRDVWRITLPMTAAFLTTPLLGLTDMAVVGRMGDAVELGGLAVGVIIFDFAFSTFNFLRSGTTGLTAQAVGEEDGREVQAVFWRAMLLAIGCGLALIVCQPLITRLGLLAISPGNDVAAATALYVFIRMLSAPFALVNYAILGHVLGRGQGGLGLALQVVINGANICLSILLGLWLGLGIAGVALGTVLGEAIGAAIGLPVVARRFLSAEHPSPRRVVDRDGFWRMIALNRDIMIRTFCLLGAFMLFTRLAAGLGSVTLAANGILLNFFMLGGFFLDGVATASEQLVGRSVGAFWRPAFDRAVGLTVVWSLALSMGLTVLFLMGGGALVEFLTTDPRVRATAAVYLPWAALTPLAGSLAFCMDGVFIGATWSRAMRDMMILSLLLFCGAAYALFPGYGNHGLWVALLAFLGFRGLSLGAMLPRRRRQTFGSGPSGVGRASSGG